MDNIKHNLKVIEQRILKACLRAGRDSKEIRLLLATKTVSIKNIRFAIEQGVPFVGENKVQELKQKASSLLDLQPEVHFIGHLQSNKINEVIKWASCIQSIDRFSIAEKLHKRLILENKTIDVYIQVNTSFEESKFGVKPQDTIALVQEIAKFHTIRIKGLMTIGLLSSESKEIRRCFRLLKQLQKDINSLQIPNINLEELSMGMSNDLEIAIEEGATIVRVGTAIFGERMYPDSYYWNESKN